MKRFVYYESDDKPKCPECKVSLKYGGEFGAPGYGQSWDCNMCKKGYAVVGKQVLTQAPIFDPSDVE